MDRKEINKRYYEKNKEKILSKEKIWRDNNSLKMRELVYEWKKNNREKHLEYRKQWRLKNIDSENERNRNWKKNNRDKINPVKRIWEQNNKKNSPTYNLNWRISNGILKALKSNKDGRHWETLVNFTLKDLKKHLEKQFIDGMNWDSFLQGNIHIDHIIPKSLFEYISPHDREFKQCWALANLQPLWAKDNINKGAKCA